MLLLAPKTAPDPPFTPLSCWADWTPPPSPLPVSQQWGCSPGWPGQCQNQQCPGVSRCSKNTSRTAVMAAAAAAAVMAWKVGWTAEVGWY